MIRNRNTNMPRRTGLERLEADRAIDSTVTATASFRAPRTRKVMATRTYTRERSARQRGFKAGGRWS